MKRYIREYWPYLLALIPVLLLRDFSPASELRYVSLASDLLKNGHFFCLRWQGEPFPYVMPFYVWLIAGLKVIFRHHFMVTIAGLLSFLPAMGILAVMNRWVEHYDAKSFRLVDGSQSRLLATVMLLTAGLHLVMTFFVEPDMLFSFFLVCALYTFWRIVSREASYGPAEDWRRRHKLQWQFGLYVFLAVFTRGSIGLILPWLITVGYLVVSRRTREIYAVWNVRGALVFGFLFALWMVGTWHEGGLAWIKEMMWSHPLSRFTHPVAHDRPFWWFFVTLPADSFPWGILSIALIAVSWVKRVRHGEGTWTHPFGSTLQHFFVWTFLVMLLYFSLRRFKLEVSVLPLYPFMIYAGVMQLGQFRWPLRFCWPMVWVARGALFLVFLGGLFCPWLNINAGCYGHVCYRANRLQRQYGTEQTYVYRLRRPQGMDTYLNHAPKGITVDDIAAGKLRGNLLIMKAYRLPRLRVELTKKGVPQAQQGEVVDEIGAYVILLFR